MRSDTFKRMCSKCTLNIATHTLIDAAPFLLMSPVITCSFFASSPFELCVMPPPLLLQASLTSFNVAY